MSVTYLQTDRGPATLADRYPVLVSASSDAARARAEMTLANAGYRTSYVPLDQVVQRASRSRASRYEPAWTGLGGS